MEHAGSSSTSSKYQNIETENFHRLCQLVVTICSDLFRDVITFRVRDLRHQLDANKRILINSNILFASQKEILYPSSNDKETNLQEMDLSLLYILLRNICNIRPPVNEWGDNPLTTDSSIGACIDRIRVKRNVLFAHARTGSIDTDSFEHNWGYLKDNIVKIAEECSSAKKYKKKVDELHNCILIPSVTKECVETINKMEEELKSELKIKKEAINESKEDSLHLHHLRAVDREAIEKCLTSIKELQERVDKLEETPGGKRKCPGRPAKKQLKGRKRRNPGLPNEKKLQYQTVTSKKSTPATRRKKNSVQIAHATAAPEFLTVQIDDSTDDESLYRNDVNKLRSPKPSKEHINDDNDEYIEIGADDKDDDDDHNNDLDDALSEEQIEQPGIEMIKEEADDVHSVKEPNKGQRQRCIIS